MRGTGAAVAAKGFPHAPDGAVASEDLSNPVLPVVRRRKKRTSRRGRRRAIRAAVIIGLLLLLAFGWAGWVAQRAQIVQSELLEAQLLLPSFQSQLMEQDTSSAQRTLEALQNHTSSARVAATDPLWRAAVALPLVGPNLSAVTEVAISADDAVNGAAKPLLQVAQTLNWDALIPSDGEFDVQPLSDASPGIISAANTVDLTYSRLTSIDQSNLLPAVSRPLTAATDALGQLSQSLKVAADAAAVLPPMLGVEGPRNYLVLVQNNAEIRATGGLAGAMAVLNINDGAITLAAQSSASELGKFDPPVEIDQEQAAIYTDRLGTYIGDVNFTPDFPTAAKSAGTMWEESRGTDIDGVIAIDPVVLAHILKASGPVEAPSPPKIVATEGVLPSELNADNVVRTLLSTVYKEIDENTLQDAYFAATSERIFQLLASGQVPGNRLLDSLQVSADEGRLYVWSAHKEEQRILQNIPLGGAISGPHMGGAAFGLYFNDGTGAKMDFYIERTVELVEECEIGEYSRFRLRVTLANTAPADAATSLPISVTGGGFNGTPPGRVKTNVIAYGPTQARIEGAIINNIEAPVGSFLHDERPVGVVTTNLGPGESVDLEFLFSKVVQSSEPALSVTPTVQRPAEVIKGGSTTSEGC